MLLALAVPAVVLSAGDRDRDQCDPAVKVIGFETPVHVHLDNKHGVKSVAVAVAQDGKEYPEPVESKPAQRRT